MKTIATIIATSLACLLTACASNRVYPEPSVPAKQAYVEVSGYGIKGTKVIHLFITFKRANDLRFYTCEKLHKETDGTHYYLTLGYGGLRVREEPYIVLTGAQAQAVIDVCLSEWAMKLAKDYDWLDHNSNEFVSKVLERAGIDRAALPKGAVGK